MRINFIQKKSFKERLWKSLNVLVGLVMLSNVSYVGAWLKPAEALASTPPTIDGVIDESYAPYASVSTGILYKAEDANFLYFAMAESRNINDNVYSNTDSDVTYDNWNKHKYSDLVGSDRAQFVLTDSNFVKKIDVTLDYLHEKKSGSGVIGYGSGLCDGLANVGKCDSSSTLGAQYIVDAKSSLDFDVNHTAFVGTTPINPAGNTNPKSPYPEDSGWEYQIIYEFKVDKAAFGAAGFGSITTPFFHNSPAKPGAPSTVVLPGIHKLVNGVEHNTASQGEVLNYTIDYFNGNSSALHNVLVTDVVDDPHLTYVNGSCGGASCSYDAGTKTITWNVGTVNGNAGGTVSFQGKIDNSLPDGTTVIYNDANIDTTETDPATSNTVDTTVTVEHLVCDLTITKAVNKTTANPGDILTYTLSYANNGNANCTGGGVRIEDNVPAGTTYNGVHTESVSNDGGGSPTGVQFGYQYAGYGLPANTNIQPGATELSWNANVVAPGESGVVTYQVTVNPVAACTTKNIDNDAKIFADQIPNGITSNLVRTVVNTSCEGNLKVIKHVINDNGGNNVAGDFTMHIKQNSSDVVSPFAGSEAGTTYSLPAGSYVISETGLPSGYAQTSIVCDGQATNTISVQPNGDHVCTVTNNDVAPSITLNKVVINDNGGTAGPNSFGLTIGGTPVASGQTLNVNANTPIALNEAGLNGYAFVGLTGDAKCPSVLGGTATLNEGEHISCTITNNDIAPKLTVIKHVINDNGGTAVAGDFTMSVLDQNGEQTFPGNESGTTVNVKAGAFIVSEYFGNGYVATYQGDCSGTIAIGQEKTCTVTNNDIPPTITLIKNVVNNNGGTAGPNDFGLTIGGNAVNSGQTVNVNANTPIVLNEAGKTGYAFVNITGDAKCPSVLGGTATLDSGESITCTITNDDIQPTLTVYKYVSNNDGGTAVPSDFTLHVNATNPDPNSFAGSDTGVLVHLDAGNYQVTEDAFTGYTPSFSQDCTGNIAVGENRVCVVTNSDDTPHLIVVKHVINDNGGTSVAGDFTMYVDGTNVSQSQFPGSEGGTNVTLNVGTFSVTESGPSGYAASYNGCSGSIALGETKTCTITNNDIAPQVTIIKHVINDNGGNNVAGDFTINFFNNAGSHLFLGDENGTTYSMNAGWYIVTESQLPGYIGTYSDYCSGTINIGEHKTCTITNNDIAPQITLTKVVINDNGGNAGVNDFGLTIGGTPVNSGDTLNVNANAPIALNEAGLDGYAFVSLTGDAKCPDVLNGTVTLDEGEQVSCTITNDDIAPSITLNKQVINDNGGNAGANDFGLTIGGTPVNSGDTLNVNANTPIALDEAGLTGYAFKEITGDKQCPDILGGTVTLDEGEHITCTIVNDDIAPTITLIKDVINDNGGNAGVNDFGLTVGGTPVNSGQTLPVDANTPIALNEAGLFGYSFVSLTGDVKCPADLGGTVTLDEGENITCTITNNDIQPLLTVTKVVINDNGGTAQVADFPLYVDATQVASGVQNGFSAGNYVVSETSNDNYAAAITGDCDVNGAVSLAVGEVKACTITNDDREADLELVKTVDQDTAAPAGVLTYTLAWSVTGHGFVKDAVLTDAIPANTTLVPNSISDNGTEQNGVITWNLGDKAAGDSGSVTFQVTIDTPLRTGTEINNEACIDSLLANQDRSEPVCDTTTTNIESDFTVTIVKSDDVDPVDAGGEITYTLDWTLDGDTPVDQLILTDTLPTSNASFVSSNPAADSLVNGVLTWDLGAYPSGQGSGSITVTVKTDSPLPDGTQILNQAVICGQAETLPDQNMVEHCDSDDETTDVTSDFAVTVNKTDDVDPVDAGGQVTYTVQWTLAGNTPIDQVTLTDTLPANVTFVSASNGGTESNGVVTWDLGAYPSGFGSGSETVTVQVASPIKDGTSLTDTAEVCADAPTLTEQEVVTHCDTDEETTEVNSAPILTIEKSNNIATFTNPGSTVGYTVTVTNDAKATDSAYNVVLMDVLPNGFTYVTGSASTAPASVVGQTIIWNVGNLAPGASFTVTYNVSISAQQAAGTYTNTATAQADNHGPVSDPSNVEVRIPQVLGATPEIDLSIEKVVVPTVTNPGKIVTYTVTVRNTGNADATNVVVTDTLPNGFTFVEGGQQVKTFVIGTLKANHERVINYDVRVGTSVTKGFYKNTAVLTADGSDPLVAQAQVEVRVPQVLGLATTGVGVRDYLIFSFGLSAFLAALYAAKRTRESDAGINA